MAEGLLRNYTYRFEALSAGIAPKGLNPLAVEAMRELYRVPRYRPAMPWYLAACVLYGAILGQSPVGKPCGSLGAGESAHLQRVEAETLGY